MASGTNHGLTIKPCCMSSDIVPDVKKSWECLTTKLCHRHGNANFGCLIGSSSSSNSVCGWLIASIANKICHCWSLCRHPSFIFMRKSEALDAVKGLFVRWSAAEFLHSSWPSDLSKGGNMIVYMPPIIQQIHGWKKGPERHFSCIVYFGTETTCKNRHHYIWQNLGSTETATALTSFWGAWNFLSNWSKGLTPSWFGFQPIFSRKIHMANVQNGPKWGCGRGLWRRRRARPSRSADRSKLEDLNVDIKLRWSCHDKRFGDMHIIMKVTRCYYCIYTTVI